MTTTNTNTNITIDSLKVPKFSQEQLDFFQNFITLLQQDRLQLDPASMDKHKYDLAYVSLRGSELQFKWIIDAHYAIVQAETNERLFNKDYDPESEMSSMEDGSEDLDIEDIDRLI